MRTPSLKLKLTYKLDRKETQVPSSSTFGDLKLAASKLFSVPKDGIALLYRGRKKGDNEVLSLSGVKNGADIKVMETEAFRQQKADEQASTEQQPQEPFMSFSSDEAAAARNAAAQEAAQRKAGAAAPPDQATCVPPSQPAKTLTPREAAAAALQKIRHEIDDLAKQAADMEQEIGNSGALANNKAALLTELLTQKLLALDNIDTQGDQELRQERKAEINRINKLLDHLEAMKGR
ncbi:g5845 [Coccomyxa viridis]|uniref:G5845 protein n=1 Tax=Coccomyxa viridis TaxID=1274662 RepID=A0ABP1FTV3_9CHLO